MDSQEARHRIFDTLRREVRRQWGDIAQKEARLERAGGYLSRVSRQSWKMPLDVLLETLEVFELEPASFFGQALDVAADPPTYLRGVAGHGRAGKAPERLYSALDDVFPPLESPQGDDVSPPPAAPPRRSPPAVLDDLVRRGTSAQKKSLRHAKRWRTEAFATAYLDHLDALRYEHPKAAAGLAETVTCELVPRLPAPRRARLVLGLRALGVYASAQRLAGRRHEAAAVLLHALELARQHGLELSAAEILERGAYVVADDGRWRRARELARAAFEIYFDHESERGMGKALVDRGILLRYAGLDREAVRVLRRAAGFLSGSGEELERNREARFHHLIQSTAALEDWSAAQRFLDEARDELPPTTTVRARLLWQAGRLELRRGEPVGAEPLLNAAMDAFEDAGHRDAVLVVLDLLLALLAQDRNLDATVLARRSLARLHVHRGFTRANLRRFERDAWSRELRPALIEELAAEVQGGRRTRPPDASTG